MSTVESGIVAARTTPPSATLPVLLLAGRDRGSTELPSGGRDQHLLHGYKAAELSTGDRPLIVELVDRLEQREAFGPVFVAGPAAVYEPLLGDRRRAGTVVLVDTDGNLGENLLAGVEAALGRDPEAPLAVMTSDVLPEPGDLDAALEDYRRHLPLDFWLSEIRVPADRRRLGRSAWKPKYRIRPTGEEQAVATLPGHLVIVEPGIARYRLICAVFELTYRTRNQSVRRRLWRIVRGALGILLAEDLRRLFRLRPPILTAEMLYHGLRLGFRLRDGDIAQETLEDSLRRIWVTRRHRRRHPERRGRVAMLDALSLARDADTVEEAEEIGLR